MNKKGRWAMEASGKWVYVPFKGDLSPLPVSPPNTPLGEPKAAPARQNSKFTAALQKNIRLKLNLFW
jgi:hypothetical protein